MRPIAATTLVLSSVLCGALGGATLARADEQAPLAVSVESAEPRVRPDAVRAAVARVLDVPIVPLLDADVERSRGILVIAIARGGRVAQLFFQMPSGRRQLLRAAAPDGESGVSWIAVAVADFFRSPPPPTGWASASEVLDPFVPRAAAGSRAMSEVLDPWAISARPRVGSVPGLESGGALGRPRPR